MAVGRQNSSRDDLGQGYGRGRGGQAPYGVPLLDAAWGAWLLASMVG